MRKRWLIVNHKKRECGVWNYGYRTYLLLSKSDQFAYDFICVEDATHAFNYYQSHAHSITGILFNWHPVTMGWLSDDFLANISCPKLILSGHDHVHTSNNCDYQFVCDPMFVATARMSGVSRPLNVYPHILEKLRPAPTFTIGTCGFGQVQKQFPHMVRMLGEQFDQPVTFRIHMPFGDYVDQSGSLAHTIKQECYSVCAPHVKLLFSHDFMPNYDDLVEWLSVNDLNIFSYAHQPGRGCSSALDAAIVSGKPWACNNSNMFRHVLQDCPQVCMDDHTLPEILKLGTQPSKHFLNKWNRAQFIQDHEHVLERLIYDQSR